MTGASHEKLETVVKQFFFRGGGGGGGGGEGRGIVVYGKMGNCLVFKNVFYNTLLTFRKRSYLCV